MNLINSYYTITNVDPEGIVVVPVKVTGPARTAFLLEAIVKLL